MSTQKVNLTVTNYVDLMNDRPVRVMGHSITHSDIPNHPSLQNAYSISLETLVFTGGAYATRITPEGTESILVISPVR